MSARRWIGAVSGQVAYDPTISVTAKAVYLALACHADRRTGYCWPSLATLGKEVGLSRRTVIRALNELREAGVIKSESRYDADSGGQRSNGYVLLDIVTPEPGGVS